jgi:predicted O-methyltransferase YrrM
MFNDIPEKIIKRMEYLERLDADIRSGKSAERGLWQISRDAGKFLSLVVSLAPSGKYIEIGTSGGYSGLWISIACKQRGTKFTTFETNKTSYKRALETFKTADVMDFVEPVNGDAKDYIEKMEEIAFCYLDGGDYEMFYGLVVPKLITGGILVADNMIVPEREHESFVQKAISDPKLDSLVVPVGTGMLFGKKV